MLLVAGPGYGKTLALDEALAARAGRSAWVRCSDADQDPGRLLRRLVEAVRDAAPGTVDVFAERLSSAAKRIDVAVAGADLIDELERRLVDSLVVVIDDAERLHRAPEALGLLRDLLGARSGRLRVAVATRQPLPLRLAKLRSAGLLSEFGTGELAFAPDECGELLRSVGRVPREAEARRLFEATEGWPLGATLGALHGDSPALRGSASRSQVFEFLAEEVLAVLSSDERRQALDSAVPRELDPGCMRALGLSPDFPERMGRTGLALRPLATAGNWLGYHPLVREFLLDRLKAEREQQGVCELNARVAPALAAAGRAEEAIDHWLAAENWLEAAEAIAELAPRLVFVQPSTVRRWLDALPDELRSAPACLLLDGTLAWEEGRNLEAIERLRSAVAGFSTARDVSGEWLARFALIDPLELMGEWEEAVTLATGFDEKPALAAGIIPPAVAAYAAAALGALGRMAECDALSGRILAHPHIGPLRPAHAVWESDRLILAGQLDRVVNGGREAVREAERSDPFNRLSLFALFLATAVTQQGRDDEAVALFERVEQIARQRHMSYVVKATHSWRALLLARNGRLGTAEEHLARAEASEGTSWREAVLQTARARIAALRGDAAEVGAATKGALELAERALLFERLQAAVELPPALVEAGMPARAHELVDDHLALLDALVPGKNGRYFRALLLAVRAWLRDAAGEEADALKDLRRMWAEAGSRNAADVVRREWRLLEPLLWKALEAGTLDPAEVVRAIADARPGGEALLPFTAHPDPAVRCSALGAAAVSGQPELVATVAKLTRDPHAEVATAATAAMKRLKASPPPLSFKVLGGFRVRRGAWMVEDAAWDRRVAQRLVRYLLLTRGSAVSEDLLLEEFWPDVPERAARQRLRVAVSCARTVLDVPGAASVIEPVERTLRLRLRERDSVDADRFELAAKAALAERGPDRRRLLERAAALWTGEPLPEERYSDWVISWREHLTALYTQLLTAIVHAADADADPVAASIAARQLVELDPLNERAHRELIVSYARSGRRAHALSQFLECRQTLVEQLGIEPERETSELQQRVLAGEAV